MEYKIATSARRNYPIVPLLGLLWTDNDNSVAIPMDYPIEGEWGIPINESSPLFTENPCPVKFSVCWLSVKEEKFYFYEKELDSNLITQIYDKLALLDLEDLGFVIGMGALGECALWLKNRLKSEIIVLGKGEEGEIPMSEFMPVRPDLSKHELCQMLLNLRENHVFNEKYTEEELKNQYKEYVYRLKIDFGKWNGKHWEQLSNDDYIPEISEQGLWRKDGSYDKTDGIFKFMSSSMPSKLALTWNINKKEYKAIFIMDFIIIKEVFERFYGAHRDTKTDFIIHIDVEKNKYELALYRYGLKEPQVIAESAYQLIVFRNKFECYRSENYDQPRGAWIC